MKLSGNGASLGIGGAIISAGAVLDLAGTSNVSTPVAISGTGISATGAIVNSSPGAASVTGAITLNAPGSSIGNPSGSGLMTLGAINGLGGTFDLTVNAAANVTIGGIIGANVTTLTKTGSGSLILSGANAHTGVTVISAGTLVAANASALGSANAGTTVASGAALDLSGSNIGSEAITLAGAGTAGGALINSSSTQAQGTGTVTLTAATTILDNSAGGISLGPVTNASFLLTVDGIGPTAVGAISGTGGLTKLNTGTLTLNGVNTFSGPIIVDNGSMAFTGGTQTLAGALTFGNAAGNTTVSSLNLSTSSVTFGGALLVRTNNATPNTITIGSGKTMTVLGAVTLGYDEGGGTGATFSNLTATGAGSLVFAGAGTTVNIGVNQAATNAAYWSQPTLDVSALGSFSANVHHLQHRRGHHDARSQAHSCCRILPAAASPSATTAPTLATPAVTTAEGWAR